MNFPSLQIGFFVPDAAETWAERMEAACRILEKTFAGEQLRIANPYRERDPAFLVRDRAPYFRKALGTKTRFFSLHSGDPNRGQRCDRPLSFEGVAPRDPAEGWVDVGGSVGGGFEGLFSFQTIFPDRGGWGVSERLLVELGDAMEAFTAHLSPDETQKRLSQLQLGYGTPPVDRSELESRLPRLNACWYFGREAAEQPGFLGWLNYWSEATARYLGFPDPRRDADLLAHSYRTPRGAWLVKLGPEPLDPRVPRHTELLLRAYERFPKLGVRAQPGAPR